MSGIEAAAKAFVGKTRNPVTREWVQAPWQDEMSDLRIAIDAYLEHEGSPIKWCIHHGESPGVSPHTGRWCKLVDAVLIVGTTE